MKPLTRNFLLLIFATSALVAVFVWSSKPSPAAPKTACTPASAAQIDAIQSGVQGVQASNSIKTAFAVKSKDFQSVYFVAAKIYGPGIEDGQAIGLWAISGTPEKIGLILAVDGFARQFTNYPDASKTDAQITQFNSGAQEALECAK